MLKRTLLVVLAALFVSASAYAVDPPGYPLRDALRENRGFPVETNDTASANKISIPIFFIADDAATNAFTGSVVDTGGEVCAGFRMDCYAVWVFTTGASPTITVDADGCTNDASLTDADIAIAFCY
jgi:hypothetical protein